MAESVKALPEEIQKIIEVSKWDMHTQKGIDRFRELQARSLPSIALDGKIMFESLIPGQEKLIEEIECLYRAKNHVAVRH